MTSADHASGRMASPAYRYYVVTCLFVLYALAYADRVIVGIVAQPIQDELGLNDAQLGVLGGLAFALLYCTMAIPVAIWADRGRRTLILTVAISLWSLFTALCGLATTFVQLFLMRIGVGIGEAGAVAPSYSLIADYFPPEKRARALSIFHLGLPLGSALGLLLGGYVAAQWGWRAAFVLIGIVGVAFAPVLWFTIREPVRGACDPVPDRPHEKSSLIEVLRHLMRRPSFLLISFAGASGGVMLYGYGFWLPAFFQRSHELSLTTTSQIVALIVIVGGVFGNLLGGWLGDRLGRRWRGAYAFIPAVAALVALPLTSLGLFAESLWIAVPLLLAPQACALLATSPIGAALQHLGPPTMRATTIALYMFIFNLAGLGIGTMMLGWVSDLFTSQFGADGLRYSLLCTGLVLYPISALLYFLASRRLTADWYYDTPVEDGQSLTPALAVK